MKKNKFNIYTAIVYTTGKPHIGNTYEIILTDAIARYKRAQGFEVYFQTGTDEHGQKIEKKALDNNKNPQQFVDEVTVEVKKVWEAVNSSHDRFVRTSDEKHKAAVANLFEYLYEKGDIYKGYYEGMYCVPCESFWSSSQAEDCCCPDCNRTLEHSKEAAYFLRLSKYAKQLEEHIAANPEFIQPESRKNEIINQFLKPGLEDLCVSRSSFNWGVKVPFDESQVIYVWLDALTNYITFVGFDGRKTSAEFHDYWPADLHVLGKDIVRFHAIYWPIILMAAELPLPKQILGHPWVLLNEDKMSKSKGNLIYADELVADFGVDAVRFYFLSQVPYANDGFFSYEMLIDKVNSELANNVGNLINRTLKMVEKYNDGVIPKPTNSDEKDEQLQQNVAKLCDEAIAKMDEYRVAESLNLVIDIFNHANKYIEEKEPWRLAKEANPALNTVLYNLVETIKQGATLLQPFLPDTATNIFAQLNSKPIAIKDLVSYSDELVGKPIGTRKVLFARIDKEAKLKELVNKTTS